MSSLVLDNIDMKLLDLLQSAFPLTGEPYADLGQKLGTDGNEVIYRIHNLKASGIVRQISPVLDARKLGYQTTLVAMKVSSEHLEMTRKVINEHPGVSHGYERDHDFNVWITLALPQEADIKAELVRLASDTGAEAVFDLPAVKVFKLRAYFGADGENLEEATGGVGRDALCQRAALSRVDRSIINGLQHDLPLVPAPFNSLAACLNMDVADFLAQCRSLLQRGIIRRFGAAINHRKAGYQANAMACWVVEEEKVDAAGRELASLREVSHCYERKGNHFWRYNLFAMVHGHSREACEEIVRQASRQTGLTDCILLFSAREFKKTRIKYLV